MIMFIFYLVAPKTIVYIYIRLHITQFLIGEYVIYFK